jgi:hypothetical protein
MRHDPGLDASPPVCCILEVEGSGYSSFHSPSAVDGQPPRKVAARSVRRYADTSAPPSKLITLLKPSRCFRVPTRLAKQSMCDSNCRQNGVGQRRNMPRLRGIRLTYAVLRRVTDRARTRALRSHNSSEACPARSSASVNVRICRYFLILATLICPLHTSLYWPGCTTVAVNPPVQTRMGDLLITSDRSGVLSPFPECERTPHLCIATLTGNRAWVDMPPKGWTRPWGSEAAYRRVQSQAGNVRGPIQL